MRTVLLAAALVAASSALGAQVPAPTPAAPGTVPAAPAPIAPELAPSFERPNGALLRAGTLTYDLTLQRGALTTGLGTRVVTVSEAALGGQSAWLLAEHRVGTVVETVDSVHLTRADLAPLRWSAAVGRTLLAASFTRDSAFGALQGYQGRSSFSIALPHDALLSAGMTERVIEMLPLRDGYRASASLVLVDGSGPRVEPAEISVARSERIDAAGHGVDCWLVLLRAGAVEQRLWVSHDGSRVVRTEQATPTGLLVGVLRGA